VCLKLHRGPLRGPRAVVFVLPWSQVRVGARAFEAALRLASILPEGGRTADIAVPIQTPIQTPMGLRWDYDNSPGGT
jgi:hypothetical protein